MIFENRAWVLNHFGVEIFWFFTSIFLPPLCWIDGWNFFLISQGWVCGTVGWLSPYMITTKTQVYIWNFYERYYVKSGVIVNSISNSWIIFKYKIPNSPYPIPHTIYPILLYLEDIWYTPPTIYDIPPPPSPLSTIYGIPPITIPIDDFL